MDANARSLTFMGEAALLKIPFFQRPYVWTKDNWEDLLEELFNSSKTHFLGSLILKQQATLTGEAKEILIIDGQQRLTTLSILLKSLYDSFPKEIKTSAEPSIRTYLFHKRKHTDRAFVLKIAHSHLDAKAYEKVMRAGLDGQEVHPAAEQASRIEECQTFFVTALAQRTEPERIALFERLLHPEYKILVVIDLSVEDNEQAIFDTINSAGVRLSASDIVKNALFQKAIQVLGPEKAVELYDSTWKKAFLQDEETMAYWEAERLTGRLRRDNLEILLHAVAVIQGFYDPDNDKLSDLAALYKRKIQSLAPEMLIPFIEDLREYARIYRNRILSLDRTTQFEFTDSHKRLMHILEILQVSTFHPFILCVCKNQSETGAVATLAQLERLVIRRHLAGQETKSYNKLCKEFIDNPTQLSVRITETTNEQVLLGLRHIANKEAALVLFWIELFRRSQNPKYDLRMLKFTYSLEHVMPQAWHQHWGHIPARKQADGSDVSPEELKRNREEKISWLGNMTLLTSHLNSSLRNAGFPKKVTGEGRIKGMKAYSDLLVAKDDFVEPYDQGQIVWDEDRIVARTTALYQEVLAMWGA